MLQGQFITEVKHITVFTGSCQQPIHWCIQHSTPDPLHTADITLWMYQSTNLHSQYTWYMFNCLPLLFVAFSQEAGTTGKFSCKLYGHNWYMISQYFRITYLMQSKLWCSCGPEAILSMTTSWGRRHIVERVTLQYGTCPWSTSTIWPRLGSRTLKNRTSHGAFAIDDHDKACTVALMSSQENRLHTYNILWQYLNFEMLLQHGW